MRNFEIKNATIDCSAWRVHIKFIRFFKFFGWELGAAKLVRKDPPKPDYVAKKVS